MAAKFSPSEQKAWVGFVRAQQKVLPAIEKRLKAEGFPPLAWYDILLELERGGKMGLRPKTLGKRLLLEKFNVSRVLDRMEREKLIKRSPCPEDSRGSLISITPKGLKLRKQMWGAYFEGVKSEFLLNLSPSETGHLANLLSKVTQSK